MRAFLLIVLVLGAFAAFIVWRMHESRTENPETPPAAGQARSPAAAAPASEPPRPAEDAPPPGTLILDRLCETRDSRGVRHALLTRPSRQGLYHRMEGGEPRLLDGGVRVGPALDLAIDGDGRAVAAYVDEPTGEVRVALPDRQPQPWIALRRVGQPERIRLSVSGEGALVSYYDAEAQVLRYSYREARSGAWRHGVASRGEGFRVVTGRPGALVLGR